MSGLEEVLAAHRYHHDPETGSAICACGWQGPFTIAVNGATAHVAAAVTAWMTERLQDEDVREAVARRVRDKLRIGPVGPNSLAILADGGVTSLTGTEADDAATAALTAVAEALREGASCEVKPECDHPGIEHGAFSYTGICPKCRKCKFIGHGPLCLDCYTSPATGDQP